MVEEDWHSCHIMCCSMQPHIHVKDKQAESVHDRLPPLLLEKQASKPQGLLWGANTHRECIRIDMNQIHTGIEKFWWPDSNIAIRVY